MQPGTPTFHHPEESYIPQPEAGAASRPSSIFLKCLLLVLRSLPLSQLHVQDFIESKDNPSITRVCRALEDVLLEFCGFLSFKNVQNPLLRSRKGCVKNSGFGVMSQLTFRRQGSQPFSVLWQKQLWLRYPWFSTGEIPRPSRLPLSWSIVFPRNQQNSKQFIKLTLHCNGCQKA